MTTQFAKTRPCTPANIAGSGPATVLSMAQTAQLSGVSEADLLGLVEYGVLTPSVPDGPPTAFDIGWVMQLQRAEILRQDLALDSHGFALALMFLNQITGLEAQLKSSYSDLRACCCSGSATLQNG